MKKHYSLRHYMYGPGSYEIVDLDTLIIFCDESMQTIHIPEEIIQIIYNLLKPLVPEGDIFDA